MPGLLCAHIHVLLCTKQQAATSKERMATLYHNTFLFLIKSIYFIFSSVLLLLCATVKFLPQSYDVKPVHKIASWNCYISHVLDTTSSIITVNMKIDLVCSLVNNIVFKSPRIQNS